MPEPTLIHHDYTIIESVPESPMVLIQLGVGQQGPPGKDGTNGTNGTDGINGTNGTNGTDGKDGINGTDSIFTDTKPVSISVGGIQTGTVIANKNALEIFEMMLFPELFGSIVNPTLIFTFNVPILQEVGTILNSISFVSVFNRGSITPQYGSESQYRSGLPISFEYQGSGLQTINTTELTITQSLPSYVVQIDKQGWTAKVNYSGGIQPKGSNGTNYNTPLPSGNILSSELVIYGVYPVFASVININSATKLSLSRHGSIIYTDMQAETISAKQHIQVPVLYGTVTSLSQYNTLSGKYDIIDLNTFSLNTITKTINNILVDYNQYTHNGPTISIRTLKWSF